MYRYDAYDHRLVAERVAQFRDQTRRFLAGELTEDEFRPLRLQNGLYIQKHAPMLRISVPYGVLSSKQLRKLAHLGRKYDRGYGHFTTRQNLQFNWPRLEDVPDILAELATVEMHAIQTSGNCVRNITTDHFAGIASDELVDPRPYAELIRQWATLNPEFAYLPRKFKIAVNGSTVDRAATLVHDIGVHAVRNDKAEVGFRILVGGGLGRTPMIGYVIRDWLPREELLNYLDAILRVYNRFGRRDNIYKARIKILVKERTPAQFTRAVEKEWERARGAPATVPDEEIERLASHFDPPPYAELPADDAGFRAAVADSRPFGNWVKRNVFPHKIPGYAAVTLSLKKTGVPPGDVTSDQMDAIAALADRYSFGELRVSHEQNLVFADVRQSELFTLWGELKRIGLATPNIGLLTDIICCPGGDFCSLANAKSIPIAEAVQRRFDNLDYLYDIGEVSLNMSGCMNACGHHHVGNIGVLGVDKNGEEWYQVSIGGAQGEAASLGKVIGPSFAANEMPDVVARLIEVYVERRHEDEQFIDTVRRLGLEPFKERVYAAAH
ncbi:MAG TPA: nitrite/sulfite reductase [Casimicrobiaceae bacterium]|jgi:sulfite reductase (NADPH) hemoprotein beta-component|nr:nitrite/sulfite reductase [Casimicrobiaceae bacterium]